WEDTGAFAEKRLAWLRRFLALPNGPPPPTPPPGGSAGSTQAPKAPAPAAGARPPARPPGCPTSPAAGRRPRTGAPGPPGPGRPPRVRAWPTEQRLSLGQVAAEDKASAITAIPRLLEPLGLHGALVASGALGCQQAIAARVVAGGGGRV